MPTVHVSEYVKEELDGVKEREGHSSLDSVIRTVLQEYEDE